MTSPIPRDVKAACLAAVPGLLAAHGLGQGAPIVQDEFGWVNPCYFVGDELVVRVNSRDPELPKFSRETAAYELARAAGVPVPDVVLHDTSCRHLPYEALVVQRLPGRSIESSWPDLAAATRAALARRVGEIMATLHEIDPGGFGEIHVSAEERAPTPLPVVRADLERCAADALRRGILDDDDIARARRVFAAREHALERVTRPALVHGDLHFGNVLHVGERVTGVLDFEWSSAGDPTQELVTSACVEEIWPGGGAPLWDAYRAVHPADPQELLRLDAYRVVHNLRMCVVSRLHFRDESDATVSRTRAHLQRLAPI